MNAFQHIREKIFQVEQVEFARIVGVSQATVWKWEAGQMLPGHKNMAAIRTAAFDRGLPFDDELFYSGPPPSNQSGEAA